MRSPIVQLLRLAWPIVLARATQAIVGFCDALMVAPLGEATLAAVTTGSMDILCLVMLPIGTLFILQSFSSQLRARGDLQAAARYGYYGLLLSLAAGIAALLLVPFVGELLRLFAYEAALRRDMEAYIAVRLLSITALVGVEALSSWYGGLGNTRIALIVSVMVMSLNVALNYLLIEPRFGLPGYGAAGAGIASAIATSVGFGGFLTAFFLGLGHNADRGKTKLVWYEASRMLRFGVPSGLNYFLEFASFVLFINVVVGHLGTTALAAFNIVFQLNMLSFMPAFGVASAGAILVGGAIGAGEQHRVWPLTALTLKLTSGWMVGVGLGYILAPRFFMGLFTGDSGQLASLLELGAFMLALSGIWQLFDAIAMTFTEALRAAGDTTWPMAARIALAWLLFTPGAWLSVLYFNGGPTAVMLSVIAYLAALALLLALRFRSGAWRRIALVAEPTALGLDAEPTAS